LLFYLLLYFFLVAMPDIVAARFPTLQEGQRVAALLQQAGFADEHLCTFYCNPAGQHGTFPIGGDRNESPGAEATASGAQKGVATGAGAGLAVGLATAPLLGPVAIAAGAALGAQAGSFAGTFSNVSDPERKNAKSQPRKVIRSSGVITAVALSDQTHQAKAVDILKSNGGLDIEYAQGTIEQGDWKDFDPLQEVKLIDV
jgi:hypothetical protein